MLQSHSTHVRNMQTDDVTANNSKTLIHFHILGYGSYKHTDKQIQEFPLQSVALHSVSGYKRTAP